MKNLPPTAARLIGIAVSLLVLGMILFFVDVGAMAAAARRIDPANLAVAVLGMLLCFGAGAFRLTLATGRLIGRRMTARDLLARFLPATLASLLLAHVLSLAGDAAKLLMLRHDYGIDYRRGLMLVLADRLVGIAATAVLALPGVAFLAWRIETPREWLAVSAVVVAVVAAAAAFGVASFLRNAAPSPVRAVLAAYLGSSSMLAEQMALAIAANAGLALSLCFIARALLVDLPLPLALAVAPLIYLGTSVPFTYAGLGTRELVCVVTLAWTGYVDADIAVLMGISMGVCILLASILGLAGLTRPKY